MCVCGGGGGGGGEGGGGGGVCVPSGMDSGQNQRIGLEQEGHERASIISSSSSLQFSSPSALMPDELYQLFILWNGVWTTLYQRCQGLESVQDIWRAFESRKESVTFW